MKLTKLLPFIGFIIFFYLIFNLDVEVVFSLLSTIRVEYVILSLAITIPSIFLKGLKWKTVIRSYETDYNLFSASKAWIIGFFMGTITPGRVGDLTRAFYLKRDVGITAGKSLTTVFIDRIVDIFVIFSVGLLSAFIVASTLFGSFNPLFVIITFFAIFVVMVIIMTNKKMMRFLLKPLSKKLIPEKYKKNTKVIFNDFYRGISEMDKRKILTSFTLALILWMVTTFQYYLLSLALGIDISFVFFLTIVPIVTIFDMLPVSFSGIGTRDAALIFFFSFILLPAEPAISLSLLVFTFNYLIPAITGFVFWVSDPIKVY